MNDVFSLGVLGGVLDNDKKINSTAKREKKMSNHQKEDWRLLSFYWAVNLTSPNR